MSVIRSIPAPSPTDRMYVACKNQSEYSFKIKLIKFDVNEVNKLFEQN